MRTVYTAMFFKASSISFEAGGTFLNVLELIFVCTHIAFRLYRYLTPARSLCTAVELLTLQEAYGSRKWVFSYR